MIECDRTDSDDVASVALPELSVLVPSTVLPSLKVTVPVGVPEVEDFTVAVNVTLWPCVEGLSDETTEVELAALVICSVSVVDTLVLKFPLPP